MSIYKNIWTPLLLFLPTIISALIAINFLSFIRPSISGISIGIGAILLGITLDYPLHILTHLRQGYDYKKVYKDLIRPLFMSAFTTSSAFLCLYFLKSQALQDLGVFVAVSVVFTVIISLILIPLFYKSKGVDVCVVRTSSIYGPYDNFNPKKSHVIPALIKKIFDTKKNEIKIWGNPNVVRDFVYVDDLAKAIVLLMNKKVTEPINFSYGKGLTIISLAKILIKLSGKKIKFKFINPKLSSAPYRVLENKLFNRIFKKFKRTGIEDGLKKTINWYLNDRKKF